VRTSKPLRGALPFARSSKSVTSGFSLVARGRSSRAAGVFSAGDGDQVRWLDDGQQVDGRAWGKLVDDGDDAEDAVCVRGQVARNNGCRQMAEAEVLAACGVEVRAGTDLS
jgi:hypothetical protein